MLSYEMRFPNGRFKALTLSYDDGVEQDIYLMEILNRYGLKCTFNLNSGRFAPDGTVYEPGTIHRRMTEKQALELYRESGHEVAIHGLTHPRLERLPVDGVTFEIAQDRRNLETLFERQVRGMAYPFGSFSDEVVEVLKRCGVVYARTTVSTGKFDIPTDWLRMPATCHHNNPSLMEYAEKFAALPDQGREAKLFYLWGHSYEFEQNNNWDVIERFAASIGGRDDIWYATNMEIYEYIRDWKRLEWSLGMRIVTNPTARTLYFTDGKKPMEIAAGETKRLF